MTYAKLPAHTERRVTSVVSVGGGVSGHAGTRDTKLGLWLDGGSAAAAGSRSPTVTNYLAEAQSSHFRKMLDVGPGSEPGTLRCRGNQGTRGENVPHWCCVFEQWPTDTIYSDSGLLRLCAPDSLAHCHSCCVSCLGNVSILRKLLLAVHAWHFILRCFRGLSQLYQVRYGARYNSVPRRSQNHLSRSTD